MAPGFLLALAIGQLCTPKRNEHNGIFCLLLAATGALWYFYIRAMLIRRGMTGVDKLPVLPVLSTTLIHTNG